MKKLIEYIHESLILEAFSSDTVKEFFKRTKELCKDEENLKYCAAIVASNVYFGAQYFKDMSDFKRLASDLGLGNFKDEYLWKGKKEYSNESGIYDQDEVVKMLGIRQKVTWNSNGSDSLSALCSKVPTAFIGLIEFGHNDKDYHYIKKIHFGMFVDPKKGEDFINHLKTHFKTKLDRHENKIDTEKNADWSLESAVKTDHDIQTYLKQASDEQKELLKKIVNETQRGNNKFLADTRNWMDSREYEYMSKQIRKALGTQTNDIPWDTFTKSQAKNKLKMFRFNVTKLLCQPEEDKLTNSSWYKRLYDDAKKYVLNAYQILHKDLKELTDEDKSSIKKQINRDWKTIITNNK